MSTRIQERRAGIILPPDLDVAGAPGVHGDLLAALDAAPDGDSIEIEVGLGDIGPLALQLLVSASRSLPSERVRFGDRAAAALATIDQSKET